MEFFEIQRYLNDDDTEYVLLTDKGKPLEGTNLFGTEYVSSCMDTKRVPILLLRPVGSTNSQMGVDTLAAANEEEVARLVIINF